MQKNKLYLLIAILVLISIFLFSFSLYLKEKAIIEERDIDIIFSIGNKTGIDLNKTALTFGRIMPGNSVSRKISIINNYDFQIKVEMNVDKELERFLSYEKKSIVEIGEEKEISIHVIISEDEDYGDYSGKLHVILKKDI